LGVAYVEAVEGVAFVDLDFVFVVFVDVAAPSPVVCVCVSCSTKYAVAAAAAHSRKKGETSVSSSRNMACSSPFSNAPPSVGNHASITLVASPAFASRQTTSRRPWGHVNPLTTSYNV
jgi:hypothetical protein